MTETNKQPYEKRQLIKHAQLKEVTLSSTGTGAGGGPGHGNGGGPGHGNGHG